MTHDPFDHDLERGLRNRRAILGDAWVDKSILKANQFNADFQNFITRFAWHEVWGRPGLEAKTRRIIVLAITTALGRWEEFELHLRAALSAGEEATRLSIDEVREVLIQSAIYAGVPAANTAHAVAMKVLRELGHVLAPLPADQAVHPGTGASRLTASRPHLHVSVREARAPRAGAGLPTVVLSHALGCDVMMWDALANALAAERRVICYDHRGHGGSEAPAGPYTLEQLAADAARVIDEFAEGQPVHFVGLSMGGMVGQALALARPELVRTLVLANTAAAYPKEARALWDERIATVESRGLEAIADGTMQRWFTPAFHDRQAATVARLRARVVTQNAAGYVATCHAIRDLDLIGRLGAIRCPTLVLAGAQDAGTPPALGRAIAEAIPGARFELIDDAAHQSSLEQPAVFEGHVRGFIDAH